MKSLVFDSGPVISISMNHVLDVLKPLKDAAKANFFVTKAVYDELVDVPWKIKRFKFEALQVRKLVEDGVIDVVISPRQETDKFLRLANSCFVANGHVLTIVHFGEMESLAYAVRTGSALVVDERVTRLLVESPNVLMRSLSRKLHREVKKGPGFDSFQRLVKGVRILRSAELVTVAVEKGFLDDYLPKMKYAKKELLDALLWGLKLDGCSLNEDEIETIER